MTLQSARAWPLALALVATLTDRSFAQTPRRFARSGEVCAVWRGPRRGEDPGSRPRVVARPCARGLRCCYPCGIPGC